MSTSDYVKDLNRKIVQAVLLGTMERQVRWIPTDLLTLHKKIVYHESALLKAETSSDQMHKKNPAEKAVLEARLKKFRNQVANFKHSKNFTKYGTLIQIIDKKYQGSSSALANIARTDVHFNIMISEQLIYRWKVEKSDKYGYQRWDLRFVDPEDKDSVMVYTLPSLITEDSLVFRIEDLPRYCHDIRSG